VLPKMAKNVLSRTAPSKSLLIGLFDVTRQLRRYSLGSAISAMEIAPTTIDTHANVRSNDENRRRNFDCRLVGSEDCTNWILCPLIVPRSVGMAVDEVCRNPTTAPCPGSRKSNSKLMALGSATSIDARHSLTGFETLVIPARRNSPSVRQSRILSCGGTRSFESVSLPAFQNRRSPREM